MLPGTVTQGELDSQPVVLIGTVPTGYTAILCPKGWATLRRWKLTTLRVARGGLYAAGEGRAGGFAAARFLLGSSGNYLVRHRNGNPFDIRLGNIVAVSRGLIRQAAIETARGPGYTNPDVRWGDGRCHSGKPLKIPSARQRLADAFAPPAPEN
ncbi:HNH endonuclease [Bradyrhizobium yuanmingense]|nr:HNH endonuclease [Bradyrhizobium yuanmingense]